MEATPEPEQPTESTLPTATTVDETSNGVSTYPQFEEAPGLEALSTAATTNMEYMPQLSVHTQSPRSLNTPQHSANNLDFILNPARPEAHQSMEIIIFLFITSSANVSAIDSPLIDPSLRSLSRTNTFISDADSVREHEVAFLLRHFGETTGQW